MTTEPQGDAGTRAGYTYVEGDKKVGPGEFLSEMAARLARRPDLDEVVERFVNMWGVDGYDPFAAGEASSMVNQAMRALLIDAREMRRRAALALLDAPKGE